MQMILPKGIVVNSPEVYAEVAAHTVIPPEKLREYWQGTTGLGPSVMGEL